MLRMVLFLLGLTIWSCVVCSCAAPALRVMTWNIHHGRGLDNNVDLERIATVIRESGADIVALQEVDVGTRRTNRRDLAGELAALTGMTHVFGKNIDYQGGGYGNAVLSRYPILAHSNHHYKMLREGEQRGLLRVEIAVGRRRLMLFDTHLDHRRADVERLQCIGEIATALSDLSEMPVLVCGDFNDTPGSRTYEAVTRHLVDSWRTGAGETFPSNAPRKRIDYVFTGRPDAHGYGLHPVRAWIPATTASDHLPLVVELRFGPRRAA